jgi:tetratricopeptide (TPR) repeat protein
MKFSPYSWLIILLALITLGAVPGPEVDNQVRLGNAAFENGDFGAALVHYTKVEDSITDPGLLAFNKGAALYRLGRFRDAELHYLRCKEDAAGDRLARVLFDLGNSLVQLAQDQDADQLERAIDYYEECLRNKDTNPELQANAQFNLQLAKVLLLRAKAANKNHSSNDPYRPDNPAGNSPANKTVFGNDRPGGLGEGSGLKGRIPHKSGDPYGEGTASSQIPNPGVGNLPPIPDKDDLLPLSPEDATAHLEKAAARVNRERRDQKQRSLPAPSKTMKDW